MEAQKVSDLFFNNIKELPLWVKQILRSRADTELRADLEDYMSSLNSKQLLQEVVPKLTFAGKNEIKTHASNLTREQMVFLICASNNYDIFEIALTNFWSLEQVCKYFVRLAQLELVDNPDCEVNFAVMKFLAGVFKTGDVLRKLGRLNTNQVDEALKIQADREKIGTKTMIAEIFIELGYVKRKDIDILMKFKEEAKKRFIMGLGLSTIKIPNGKDGQMVAANMQREMKRLAQENAVLKERLKKILNIKG